jgi:hypothetical protein
VIRLNFVESLDQINVGSRVPGPASAKRQFGRGSRADRSSGAIGSIFDQQQSLVSIERCLFFSSNWDSHYSCKAMNDFDRISRAEWGGNTRAKRAEGAICTCPAQGRTSPVDASLIPAQYSSALYLEGVEKPRGIRIAGAFARPCQHPDGRR